MVSLKNYPSKLKLFDPHSRKPYKVTNPKEKFHGYVEPGQPTTVYASKFGWLLLGREHSSLWLHDPFTNETLFLPVLGTRFIKATFTMDPKSPGCEVLVFSTPYNIYCHTWVFSINIYRLSSDTDTWSTRSFGRNKYGVLLSNDTGPWRRQILGKYVHDSLNSIHYMNGKIYCLFQSSFRCYDLADKSWTKIKADMPVPAPNDREPVFYWPATRNEWRKCLLTGKGEDLLMVCCDTVNEFKVFYYDWSFMCWTEAATALYTDATFFIDGDKILMLDNFRKSGCFCLKQSLKVEQTKEYDWIEGDQWSTMNFFAPYNL